MKALTLRQPWATAIFKLGKTIENRRWNTSFRGRFLIHAAKGMTAQELADAKEFCEDVLGISRCYDIEEAFRELPRSGILGMATLASVVAPRPPFDPRSPEPMTDIRLNYPPAYHDGPHALDFRWHMSRQYGFILEDIKPLPFVPMNGALGFHEVPKHVLEELGL